MEGALHERPLTIQEAYDALDRFGRDSGRVRLLLLLHAAVPQSFRADLLNLLKVNFLEAETGSDLTVDADVLLSPLVQPAAAGYYRLDPEVRRHCLALLDAAYRDRPARRSVQVARFLLAYAEALERQAGTAARSVAGRVSGHPAMGGRGVHRPRRGRRGLRACARRGPRQHDAGRRTAARRGDGSDFDSADGPRWIAGIRPQRRRDRPGRRLDDRAAARLDGRQRASRRRRDAAASARDPRTIRGATRTAAPARRHRRHRD